MTRIYLFTLISLWLCHHLVSQSKRLTFEQCVEMAISNNIQVKMQSLTAQQSKDQYLKSKMQFLPSINANANQGFTLGRTIDPLTNEFAESNVRSNNFALSANWTLFSGFQNINNLRQNYYILQASEQDLLKTQADIMLSVTSSFLQILLAEELYQVSLYQYGLTKQQVERTKKIVRGRKYSAGYCSRNGIAVGIGRNAACCSCQFIEFIEANIVSIVGVRYKR